LLSVRATGISLPSRSQRCNVLTETPRSFAALPVLIVLSKSIITHYRVLYGKLESGSTRKSISLRSSASPRITEPKTRTYRAPCLAAIRSISSRWAFNRSPGFMDSFLIQATGRPWPRWRRVAAAWPRGTAIRTTGGKSHPRAPRVPDASPCDEISKDTTRFIPMD